MFPLTFSVKILTNWLSLGGKLTVIFVPSLACTNARLRSALSPTFSISPCFTSWIKVLYLRVFWAGAGFSKNVVARAIATTANRT